MLPTTRSFAARLVICLAICLTAFGAVCLTASAQQIPGPGVFYSTGAGLAPLFEAPSPAFGSQGFGTFLADPVNPAYVNHSYPGSDAPVRIAARRPVFYANLGFTPDRNLRLVQIVRLDRKHGFRRARYSWHSGTMLGAFDHAVPVRVSAAPGGVLILAPAADLEPGEYLLSFGPLGMQYDFSVS